MFTISIYHLILLIIHQINSDVFYRLRRHSGSSFIFDALTRNLTVSSLSDIKVLYFLALLVDATLRRAIAVETLAQYMWVTSNAKELLKLLRVEQDLGVSVIMDG